MPFAVDDRTHALRNDNGTWRVGQTRVTLDSVISAFQQGSTPDQIRGDFPTLDLADVYEVIAHYLRHKTEVDRYLAERDKTARSIRTEIEGRLPPKGLRGSLKAKFRKSSTSPQTRT